MSCREKSFVNFLSSDYCHSNYCWIQSQFFNKNVPGTSTSPTKELLTEEFHRVNLIVRLFPGFAGLQSKIVASRSSNFSVVHHSSPKVRNDSDKIIWAKRAKPTISTFSIMLLFQSIGQQLVRVVDDVDFSAFSRLESDLLVYFYGKVVYPVDLLSQFWIGIWLPVWWNRRKIPAAWPAMNEKDLIT